MAIRDCDPLPFEAPGTLARRLNTSRVPLLLAMRDGGLSAPEQLEVPSDAMLAAGHARIDPSCPTRGGRTIYQWKTGYIIPRLGVLGFLPAIDYIREKKPVFPK